VFQRLQHDGWTSAGNAVFSSFNQIVSLTGGGYCGWIAPQKAQGEHLAVIGGWHLKLKLCANKLPLRLNEFPVDIIRHVISFLEDPIESWGNYRLVSKQFRDWMDDYRNVKVSIEGKEVTLFRHQESRYITLKHPSSNFSMYKVSLKNIQSMINFCKIPSRKPWNRKDEDVVTTWFKLRFDPTSMLVHTGDFTFAK
jgi:hypothetical protein